MDAKQIINHPGAVPGNVRAWPKFFQPGVKLPVSGAGMAAAVFA